LREMPPWSQPCPLKATVTMGGSGGATSFAFDNGQVLGQRMHIEGTLDRLLASVLPHEVTHTVFAFHFRQPVPRWADEGGSVLSEDEQERRRHDLLVRRIINDGRLIPLRRLFALREYPSDVMALYAEGFSVSEFLVSRSSRPAPRGRVPPLRAIPGQPCCCRRSTSRHKARPSPCRAARSKVPSRYPFHVEPRASGERKHRARPRLAAKPSVARWRVSAPA